MTARSQLTLPRFELQPLATRPATEAQAPQRSTTVVAQHVATPVTPAPLMRPQARAVQQPVVQQPVVQQPVEQTQPLQYVPPRPPVAHPAARPMTVTYAAPMPADDTLLQRITPVHIGAMMVIALLFVIMTSGAPGSMSPVNRLPALATDATASLGLERSNRLASQSALGSSKQKQAAAHGGIPSASLSASMRISGGGRAAPDDTSAVRMAGIPSPAMAAKMGPRKLALRPSDGVTLPRSFGERDSHSIDSYYGVTAELGLEKPVQYPAVTPGAAALDAQVRSNEIAGKVPYGAVPASLDSGMPLAY